MEEVTEYVYSVLYFYKIKKHFIEAIFVCKFYNLLFLCVHFIPHPPIVAPFPPLNKNMWRLHFSPFPSGSVVREEPLGSLYFCQAGPLAFLQPLGRSHGCPPTCWDPDPGTELRFSGRQLLPHSAFDHLTTWKHNS